MGIVFNDPDVDFDDIYWYNVLAIHMKKSIVENDGLVVFDYKLNAYTCYVELHRKG